MMDATSVATARSTAAKGPSHPVWWWIGTFGGAFLGVVLLVAVWAKMLDPMAFEDQIRLEGLDFLFSAQTVALIALALETGLGLALLLGVRRKWVLIPAVLLVAFFLFLTGRAWYMTANGLRDPAESCGCFGNLVQRTPAEAFWQDLLLLVPALGLAFVGRDRRTRLFPPVRTAVAVLGAAAVAAFAWKSPELPLDDLATRLRPGGQVASFCAGGGDAPEVCLDSIVPELREGEHLVILANLDDAALTDSVDALNAFAEKTGNPRLWVLSPSPSDQHRAFFWKWGPRFEIRETPLELIRPLYRRLPRSFLVEGGKVARTFAGMPPALAAHPPQDSSERSSV
ncbi:MAG TPA: MauE/DoxX family redox-associated membrane protein [Thermoanaerobaculia bacterium]